MLPLQSAGGEGHVRPREGADERSPEEDDQATAFGRLSAVPSGTNNDSVR